jgi:hypothetical protein
VGLFWPCPWSGGFRLETNSNLPIDEGDKVASVSDAQYLRRLATLIHSRLGEKHLAVDKALALIDELVRPTVRTRRLRVPPINPADGERWIVGANPTGTWAGKASQIAMRIDGTWSFLQPKLGCALAIEDERISVAWRGGTWHERLGGGALNPPIRFIAFENELTLTGAFVETDFPKMIADRIALLALTTEPTETIVGPSPIR